MDDRNSPRNDESNAAGPVEEDESRWPAPLRRGRFVAERGIVGCVLAVPSLIDEVMDEQGAVVVRELIMPDRFRNSIHRTIISTCLDLARHGYSDEQPLPEFDDPAINDAVSDAYWTVHRETVDADADRVRESLRAYLSSLEDYELEEARLGIARSLGGDLEKFDSTTLPEQSPGADSDAENTDAFARIRQLQQFHSQKRRRRMGTLTGRSSANHQSRIVDTSSAPESKNTTTIHVGQTGRQQEQRETEPTKGQGEGEGAS